MTFSWALDENAGMSISDEVTVWKSIFSEGLRNPRIDGYHNHCGKYCTSTDSGGFGIDEPNGSCDNPGLTENCLDPDCPIGQGCTEPDHGAALLLTSSTGLAQHRVSLILNLFAHNQYRHPMVIDNDDRFKVYYANNIIYNWEDLGNRRGMYRMGAPNESSSIGNIGIKGVDTGNDQYGTSFFIVGVTARDWSLYVEDNYCPECYQPNDPDSCGGDDWKYVNVNGDTTPATQLCTPTISFSPMYSPIPVNSDSGAALKATIASDVGARPLDRDAIDTRVISDFVNIQGKAPNSVVDTPEGDWPTGTGNVTHNDLPSNPHVDSGNGYTNLELWLESKAIALEDEPPPASLGSGMQGITTQ